MPSSRRRHSWQTSPRSARPRAREAAAGTACTWGRPAGETAKQEGPHLVRRALPRDRGVQALALSAPSSLSVAGSPRIRRRCVIASGHVALAATGQPTALVDTGVVVKLRL